MSELQQAKEMREEARTVLAECRETLAKIDHHNDLSLKNQRAIVFATARLLPRPLRLSVQFSDADSEQAIMEDALALVAAVKQRELFDIVHAINVLAMANTDIFNIHTNFRGCGNLFVVRVRPLSAVSPEGDESSYLPVIYHAEVSFVDGFYVGCPEGDCPIQRLLRIESEVTELIIEAREEAEAKAEVKA